MEDAFVASFCHKGVLGGAIYLQPDKAVYRTNKITVDAKYRNLEMFYKDIEEVKTGHILFFPTVSIVLKEAESYKFIVFSQKKFLKRINDFI